MTMASALVAAAALLSVGSGASCLFPKVGGFTSHSGRSCPGAFVSLVIQVSFGGLFKPGSSLELQYVRKPTYIEIAHIM